MPRLFACTFLLVPLRNVQSRAEFRKTSDEYTRRKSDGSTPSISAYLLRWLLFIIDGPGTGGLGLLVVLLTKNSQRLGDLAAGTMVIKEKNYRKIHVSLDEFDYLTKNYHPTYPQSADLSLEQVNVITRTLESGEKDRVRRVTLLAKKVPGNLICYSTRE